MVRPVGSTSTDLATALRHEPCGASRTPRRTRGSCGRSDGTSHRLLAERADQDVPATLEEREPSLAAFINLLVEHGAEQAVTAAWLLWPILTLGIYHLVWYYKIHKEMAEFDRRRAVPVAGPMLVLLLLLGWTVIAPLISYYNCGTRIRNAQRAAGIHANCSPGCRCATDVPARSRYRVLSGPPEPDRGPLRRTGGASRFS